jgi:two-component system chemotaxis response regulator CheB
MSERGQQAGHRVRVLIVDDSALMRQILRETLESDAGIEVVGTASDPFVARNLIKLRNPDVITLDVEMPRLDGLSFLEKLMRLRPTPVVMISALTRDGADVTLRALELGAVDFVPKPTIDIEHSWPQLRDEVIAKIKAAAGATLRSQPVVRVEDNVMTKPPRIFKGSDQIVAIGASTGGVMALGEVLSAMPADAPGILVVQHMPPKFTQRFAERLDGKLRLTVVEAEDGQAVLRGHVYVAPGDRHLSVIRSGAKYRCKLSDGPAISGHIPSSDVLFRSVAEAAAGNAIGVLLTGMGRDGAEGLLAMRQAGAFTIGQDEASCLIYGMPRAARELGAVDCELPLGRIAESILTRAREDAA